MNGRADVNKKKPSGAFGAIHPPDIIQFPGYPLGFFIGPAITPKPENLFLFQSGIKPSRPKSSGIAPA
jgi:hypothetical protein